MKITNWINGKSVETKNTLDLYEPATGKVYGSVSKSDAQDVEAAIAAAQNAFKAWSQTPVFERSRILRKLSSLIDANLDELARAESKDAGKPFAVSKLIEIPRSSLNFSFFADLITGFGAESFVSDPNPRGEMAWNMGLRQPLGVVACISPWNLPLYLFTWKIAPALAAGNTVVAKPSEFTPLTASLLGPLAKEAGLPDGVLNIIHGLGGDIGSPLVTHPKVKAVSFTGSTKTGSTISSLASPLFKKLSLELGGKNPFIICDDADLERATSEAVRAAFSNQGQICLCGSRILIHQNVYDRVRDLLIAKTRELIHVDPLDESPEWIKASKGGPLQGAVVSKVHYDKIIHCLEIAKSEGGKILIGGKKKAMSGRLADGYFIEPTLIEGLGPHCQTNQQEIFGPVSTLQPFDSDEEAIQLANSTEYGLSAAIFTSNQDRAIRLARHIDAGVVWVNTWMLRDVRTPFGGVKASGVGREGGTDALRFFTESKNVCFGFQKENA